MGSTNVPLEPLKKNHDKYYYNQLLQIMFVLFNAVDYYVTFLADRVHRLWWSWTGTRRHQSLYSVSSYTLFSTFYSFFLLRGRTNVKKVTGIYSRPLRFFLHYRRKFIWYIFLFFNELVWSLLDSTNHKFPLISFYYDYFSSMLYSRSHRLLEGYRPFLFLLTHFQKLSRDRSLSACAFSSGTFF